MGQFLLGWLDLVQATVRYAVSLSVNCSVSADFKLHTGHKLRDHRKIMTDNHQVCNILWNVCWDVT